MGCCSYQLVDAVDGPVVLVTQSLHALKAAGRKRKLASPPPSMSLIQTVILAQIYHLLFLGKASANQTVSYQIK